MIRRVPPAPRAFRLTFNKFCPTGPGGGVDPHCGGGPSSRQRSSALAKVQGGIATVRKVADKLRQQLVDRYGARTAGAIVVAAQAVSWGSAAGAVAVGLPGAWIPSPVGALPFIALAEMRHRMKRRRREARNAELADAEPTLVTVGRDWLVKALVAELEPHLLSDALTTNAAPAKRPPVPSAKIDPTRTGTIRAAFARRLRVKWKVLRGLVWQFVVQQDSFGLARQGVVPLRADNSEKLGVALVPVRDFPAVQMWKAVQAILDPADVLKLEDEPHITVRYGFLGGPNEASQVAGIAQQTGAVGVRLGGLSLFRNPDADVLKVEVEAAGLHRLNAALSEVPNYESYPKYLPHLTVAHLRPGTGDKYLRPTELDGHEFVADRLVYSDAARSTWEVSLNASFAFESDPKKLQEFEAWLRQRFGKAVLGKSNEDLWRHYLAEGFKKGAGRAFDDTKASEAAGVEPGSQEADWLKGGRDQFLRSAFGRPESVEKVKLIASRTMTDLRNVTDDMATKMVRVLADGLTQGMNPRQVGDLLDKQLDLGLVRADTIARTEFIRAHAEGQLDSFEALGVAELGVEVEWSTAGDLRVCKLCEGMNGKTFAVQNAHGLIPAHPNCRCAFLPANVGERDRRRTPVGNAATRNVFCPTGSGGGIDPHCSPRGGGHPQHRVPDIPWFHTPDPKQRDQNVAAAKALKGHAEKGDLEAVKAHPGTGSPRLEGYRQQLIGHLQGAGKPPEPAKAPPPKPQEPVQGPPGVPIPAAPGAKALRSAASAATGIPEAGIAAAAGGKADPSRADHVAVRNKVAGHFLSTGTATQDAVVHLLAAQPKGANDALVASITKGNVAAAQKEFADTPHYDLQCLSEMEVRSVPVQGEATCHMGTRKLTMGSTTRTGSYRHELGHAIHSMWMQTPNSPLAKAAGDEWKKVQARLAADPIPPGKKLSHEEYEKKYGVVDIRSLDNEKENVAEHYRLYHRELYRDKYEGGGGKHLAEYRARHPGWAKIWDAHYSAALTGGKE